VQIPPDVLRALTTLLNEVLHGPPGREAYMLNGGDRGLLGSLEMISAADASATGPNGSSIAAHTDHLRYGFSLMNRWAQGEKNPFASADWGASWRRTAVNDDEWNARRRELRDEALRWKDGLNVTRDINDVELAGVIGSIAHTAYHLGAIRQMQPALRGPRDGSAPATPS
jgi:hypothetical protein